MLLIALHGGLVSQIRAFYIGYKISKKNNDSLVLDLSQYYNGYYRPYMLGLLNIPHCPCIATRGSFEYRIEMFEKIYHKNLQIIRDGEKLEQIYKDYDSNQIYYLANDGYCYDAFCQKYHEFSFLYINDDLLTTEIMEMMKLNICSEYIEKFENSIRKNESVGIHIRLQDFIKIGWTVPKDYDYYRASIQWCRENLKNPIFYVFSDDIDVAKEILGIQDDIYYMERKNFFQNDVEQLLCLSKCKHRILSKISGFSMFSATIEENKWKQKGYTIIAEQTNLDENTTCREHVDFNFDDEPVRKEWKTHLYHCILLENCKIKILNEKYLKRSKYIFNEKRHERISKKNRFIFATLQTYSEQIITGMERMAKCFAYNNEVHFVGTFMDLTYDKSKNDFLWTLENSCLAKDFNGNLQNEYYLYPYAELNEKNKYMEFIQYLNQNLPNLPTYIIVRKVQALPPLVEHKNYNVKFIFVDFTDNFELESRQKITEEDLNYLYENADLVITYDNAILRKYSKICHKFMYVNMKKFYPDIKVWDNKIYNWEIVNECEDKLYDHILDIINDFFNK